MSTIAAKKIFTGSKIALTNKSVVAKCNKVYFRNMSELRKRGQYR